MGIGVEPGPVGPVRPPRRRRAVRRPSAKSGSATAPTCVVEGYEFAPTFSIWTTIEECLNPPLIWERERGFYTTAPFSEPEMFEFPEGIGRGRMRERRARGGRADPPLGGVRAGDLQVRARQRVHRRCSAPCTCSAWTRPSPCSVRGVEVSPRDVVAAVLPDPATLGDRMTRPHLRRHLGAGNRAATASPARPTSTTWSTTSTRCASTAARRSCGRRPSTPPSRSSCSTAASGRGPACSVPRPSRPSRSWSCSPSTAHRTGVMELDPAA